MMPDSVKPAETGLDDEGAVALLARRVQELQAELERIKVRVSNSSARWTAVAFALCAAALIGTLYLAIAPYLGVGQLPVPAVISYIAAFAVLYFAYLTHVAFQNTIATLEYRRTAELALRDGEFALRRAYEALAEAQEAISKQPPALKTPSNAP